MHADRDLVCSALNALVDNAVSFSDGPSPLIDIGWRLNEAGQVVLTVRDEGIGMADHALESVFEMFTRLDKRRGKGLGVGLAMARRCAELCGGGLTLSSEPAVGTTAHLVLPVAP